MTARLSLFFSCDKDKQIFHYFLLCIYTICSKSVLSLQHGCTGYTALYTYFNNWLQNVPTDCRLNSLLQLLQQLVTVHRPTTQPHTVALTNGYRVQATQPCTLTSTTGFRVY